MLGIVHVLSCDNTVWSCSIFDPASEREHDVVLSVFKTRSTVNCWTKEKRLTATGKVPRCIGALVGTETMSKELVLGFQTLQ